MASVPDEFSEWRRRAAVRLHELEPLVAEYHELQAVVARLDKAQDPPPSGSARRPGRRVAAAAPGRDGTASGRTSRAGAAKRKARQGRRRAAAPGSRERDLVRLVGERPGISVPEIARELNVDATGLYAIVRRLSAKGQLRKEGTKLTLVADES